MQMKEISLAVGAAEGRLLERLRADGHPAVVSGAGPSVLAFGQKRGVPDTRPLTDEPFK